MKIEEAKLFLSVDYVPAHANGDLAHPDVERGEISNWNDKSVFVKFNDAIDSLGWSDATAKGCNPEDLVVCATSPMRDSLVTATASALGIGVEPKAIEGGEAQAREMREDIDKYFSIFVLPPPKGEDEPMKCILCGSMLTGILGTFVWDILNGEGFCSRCGYPARAIHRVKHRDGKEMFTLGNFVLQYHPDYAETGEQTEEDPNEE